MIPGNEDGVASSELESRKANPTLQIFAVFLCGVIAFLDLYCTQPLLPLLSKAFQASEASVSLTVSASTLGVAFSAAMLAMFGERLNRKKAIVGSMTALAVCALLTATSTTLHELIAWRLLQGLVTPGIFIITIAYVTEEWPALQVPKTMSFYVGGTVFGGFMGRVIGGSVSSHTSWRWVFVLLGLLGLMGAAVTQRLLRPSRAKKPVVKSSFLLEPVWDNTRNPRLMATFLIGFCMLFTLVSTFSYITFYLAAAPFSLSTQQLSWLFAVYLCGLFATLAAGRVLARIGLRRGMLGAIGIGLLGIALTLVHVLGVVALGLALVGSCVFIAQTCANSFLRDAAPGHARVAAAGMYICSYYIGGTVGGVQPGLLWRYGGWPGCVALTGGFLVVAGLITFFGWSNKRRDPIPL